MNRFYLAFVFLLIAITTNSQDLKKSKSDIFTTEGLEQILKRAKKEHKLIFIDLYFVGCAPCDEMEANVFPNPKVATILKKDFISFKSDIIKEEIGGKISMKYAATGFPTLILLAPNMEVIDIISGFYGVDDFSNVLIEAKKYKKFSASFDLDYPDFYRAAYMEGKRNVPFEKIDTYLKQQKSLDNEIPFVIITGLRVGGEYSEYIFENAIQLAENYGRLSIRNNLNSIVISKAKILGKKKNLIAFNKVLAKAKPVFTNEEWNKFSTLFTNNFNNQNIEE